MWAHRFESCSLRQLLLESTAERSASSFESWCFGVPEGGSTPLLSAIKYRITLSWWLNRLRLRSAKPECAGLSPAQLSISLYLLMPVGQVGKAPDSESGDRRFEPSTGSH